MAPCVRFSLLGKAVPRLIGFCPVCVSWQKRSVTAPFGHRLSDELSEIILDYLHFDHRLTTTVQRNCKTPKKPVVTTDNGLFLVLVVTVQNQQILRFNVSLYCPVVVFRPGRPEVRIPSGCLLYTSPSPRDRTKSSTLWGAALFVLHGFYKVVKEGIRTARTPRFASRGAETPQWGVSRARLGESLRAHSKTSLQCVFAMRFFL